MEVPLWTDAVKLRQGQGRPGRLHAKLISLQVRAKSVYGVFPRGNNKIQNIFNTK